MTTGSRIVAVAAAFVAFLVAAQTWAQTPLGAAFTYQGQLDAAGVPLTGDADFRFSLWDDPGVGDPPVGGVQLGPTLAFGGPGNPPPITVSAGRFAADLDFGVGVFTDHARWLQIAVRHPAWDGSGSEPPFTTLAPRQPLTPAPFAIKTLGVSPRQITALETDGVFSELVYVSAPTTYCLQAEVLECDEMTIIELILSEGARMDFELFGDNQAVQFEIVKHRPPTASTVNGYAVDLMLAQGPTNYAISMSPAEPVYNSTHDPASPITLDFTAMLVSGSRLLLRVFETNPFVTATQVVTDSTAEIEGLQIDPYDEHAHDATLRVNVRNAGSFLTNYIVTVTGCGETVDLIPAQSGQIGEGETGEFIFNLHNSVPFGDTDTCTVKVLSQFGKPYVTSVVDFPPPGGG